VSETGGDASGGPTTKERAKGEQAFEQARAETAAGADLPQIDFSTFVLSLSHSALVHLGDAPGPTGATEQASLPLARQTIDLLSLLQEKTRGNLSGAEETMVEQVLYELRMRYVQVSKTQ
jgi:hypothetical protein